MNSNTGPQKYAKYYTVGLTDLLLAASAWLCAYEAYKSTNDLFPAFGYAIGALASSAGVIRFIFFPVEFGPLNEGLGHAAANVGTPLIIYSLLSPLTAVYPPRDVALAFFVIFGSTRYMSLPAQDNVIKLLNTGVIGVLVYDQILLGRVNTILIAGTVLFLVTGIGITNDRHRYLFGCRRENLFHIGLAIAFRLLYLSQNPNVPVIPYTSFKLNA